MGKKTKTILVALAAVAMLGGAGYYSYARYSSEIGGNASVTAAKWAIKVNEVDVTGEGSTLGNTLALTLDENTKVVDQKIAPGRGGHFTVEIDPDGTEVELGYTIALGTTTGKPEGMTITGYTVNGGELQAGTTAQGTIELASTTTGLTNADKKTVVVYVNWADDDANNADDTEHASTATTPSVISIPVTVTLSQSIPTALAD